MRRIPTLALALGLAVTLAGCGPAPTATPYPTNMSVPTATPAAPRTSFGDGTWLVGVDIVPGTYRTTLVGDYCLWERLSGLSGTYDDVIAWGAPLGGVAQLLLYELGAGGSAGGAARGVECGAGAYGHCTQRPGVLHEWLWRVESTAVTRCPGCPAPASWALTVRRLRMADSAARRWPTRPTHGKGE